MCTHAHAQIGTFNGFCYVFIECAHVQSFALRLPSKMLCVHTIVCLGLGLDEHDGALFINSTFEQCAMQFAISASATLPHHSLVNEVKFARKRLFGREWGNGKKEIYRIDALTARQNCNRNEFNSTKYFEFFSWSASFYLSLSVPHSNVLVGSFPIFRNTCLVWGNFKVRNAQLSPPWTFLWFRNDITGDRVRVCVRWLSSIWNDHHEPEHQPTNLSRKTSPNRIFVCAKCIFMAHNRILRVCLYMRMWLHDNSNNNFIFWANLFSHAWMKCFHFSFFSSSPFIPKSITHSCFRKAYRLEWHD